MVLIQDMGKTTLSEIRHIKMQCDYVFRLNLNKEFLKFFINYGPILFWDNN